MGLFSKIDYTEIVDTGIESKKSAGSSIVRGAVGGALFGGAGLVGGALSGKNKTKTKITFRVVFKDGTETFKTCDLNDMYYTTFMKYVKKD